MAAMEQIMIKVLSIGDAECGKSCFIKRYCEGRFVSRYIPTIGVDYGVKKINIKNFKVAVNFFDLSGDQDFINISKEFIQDSQGILLMYDCSDQKSFLNLVKWEKMLKDADVDLKKNICFLIQTKNDIKTKEVSSDDGKKFAQARGIDFFTCSSNTGENVQEIFDKLMTKVIDRIIDYRQVYLK